MSEHRAYIGDGVYVDIDPDLGIVLTTENGIEVTNRIVLEPDVLLSFVVYCRNSIFANLVEMTRKRGEE